MNNGFVKSSPHFFKLINRSIYVLVAILLVLTALIPAPLQEQANPASTPNPAKSAWFLLWVQELISWSHLMIWPVMLTGGLFLLLPWLPIGDHIHRASWFPRQQKIVSIVTIIFVAIILGLTIRAYYFRGANWSLVF